MEHIIDGWTLAFAGMMVSGGILLLIIARNVEWKKCYEMGRLRWLLWICPKRMKKLPILDVFPLIIFEVLFAGEMIAALYSYIIPDIYSIDSWGYFWGVFMQMYTFVNVIYMTIWALYVTRKYNISSLPKKINMKQIENIKSAKIGGGGLFRPLAKGMLVLSILIFLNYIKQIFVAIMSEQAVLNFLPKTSIMLIVIVWLVLVINCRIKTLAAKEDELIFRNWYGRKICCPINEIQKIEANACAILLWKNKDELFAKFNTYTEGFETILEDNLGR